MALVHHPALSPPGQPVCSVCIANYNGEALLVDCIESVLAQRGAPGFEILVHDDASTDGSVALLRERYPQVEVLASEENVGFCISNNRMVARARGEYVLLLNNDAALFPDALATLLDAAAAHARPCILTLPQYDWESGGLVDRGCLLDPFYNPVPNLDPARSEVAYVIGACLWIPRGLWKDLGGFPEWMGSLAEDLYIGCQARLRGHAVRALPSSGYRHRQGASFGGNRISEGRLQSTYRRRALSEQNKTSTLVVLTPGALVWGLLALHLATLCFEGLFLTALRRDITIWRQIYWPAIRSPLGQHAFLAVLRRQEQARRSVSLSRYLQPMRLFPRKLAMLWIRGMPKIS